MNASSANRPRVYRILLQGRLDDSWADWFDGMTIRSRKDEEGMAVTSLTGAVEDQAALHGVLARIRDLWLTLLQVECLEKPFRSEAALPDGKLQSQGEKSQED